MIWISYPRRCLRLCRLHWIVTKPAEIFMTPKNAIIEVNNLAKNFGKVPAVKGISFNVYEGEICGLLGPNGAGKTTTIQMLLDLITPTSGSVKIFGKEMKGNREEIFGAMNFSSITVFLGVIKVSAGFVTVD